MCLGVSVPTASGCSDRRPRSRSCAVWTIPLGHFSLTATLIPSVMLHTGWGLEGLPALIYQQRRLTASPSTAKAAPSSSASGGRNVPDDLYTQVVLTTLMTALVVMWLLWAVA